MSMAKKDEKLTAEEWLIGCPLLAMIGVGILAFIVVVFGLFKLLFWMVGV